MKLNSSLKVTLHLEAALYLDIFRKSLLLKIPVADVFLNKATGWRLATLLKTTLRHWCFLVNFINFLRTPFLQNTSK